MKQIYLFLMWALMTSPLTAQKSWSGNGGNQAWNNPGNWNPSGVPSPEDDIILDNGVQHGDYTVLLPSGMEQVTIKRIAIIPAEGNNITLILPPENTLAPALIVNGEGNSFVIGKGGIFKNSSGASSGDAVSISNNFCIYNGGRYVHNTPRGNAQIIDRLSVEEGTEKGIFEFDVPGSAGYTVSLTGNNFGSLYFSASSGSKSYSGNGASLLKIRGDLKIGSGVSVTSTLTSDIQLYGNLEIDGTFNLNPSTPGTTNRSLMLYGNPIVLRGNGICNMNAYFRNITLAGGSECHLEKSISLPNNQNGFTVQQNAKFYPNENQVGGAGRFVLETGASIYIKKSNGITDHVTAGQVEFSQGANYHFIGEGDQFTGMNFPDEITTLMMNKSSGRLILSKDLHVTGGLHLSFGILKTSQNSILTLSGPVESPANQYGHINAGWEKSFIDGPVRMMLNGGDPGNVPVGKNGHFAPVSLHKISSGTGTYLIEYFNEGYPTHAVNTLSLHHVSKLEYWMIHSAGNSAGQEVQLTLSWRPFSAVSTDASRRNDLRVAQFTGDKWEGAGHVEKIEGDEFYGSMSGITTIQTNSVYTIGSASTFNILPLKDLKLQTKNHKEHIELIWSVESDEPIEFIQPEKSRNGQTFQPVRKIFYRGTDHIHFTLIDSFPFNGPNYYRIGVKIPDDSMIYSPVSYIIHKAEEKIRIFPNPARDHINIFFSDKSSSLEYVIVNSIGSVITGKQKLKEDLTRIPLTGLPPGRYTLIFYRNKEVIALPFLKLSIL